MKNKKSVYILLSVAALCLVGLAYDYSNSLTAPYTRSWGASIGAYGDMDALPLYQEISVDDGIRSMQTISLCGKIAKSRNTLGAVMREQGYELGLQGTPSETLRRPSAIPTSAGSATTASTTATPSSTARRRRCPAQRLTPSRPIPTPTPPPSSTSGQSA